MPASWVPNSSLTPTQLIITWPWPCEISAPDTNPQPWPGGGASSAHAGRAAA